MIKYYLFFDGGGGGGGGIAAGLKFVGLVRVTPARGVGLFNDSFKLLFKLSKEGSLLFLSEFPE
ncbi:hypothetical protein QL982_05605 [Psychrobacter sp. 5A.1]|uniref:hypothetical protein n=1 Tax=Psychrobacter sp. 5A.1 TaxID=3035207 RepID=UPI0025B51135|nr:hypothetical protein [Psychrobacter sp. 5A.1]MDN3502210.1 hypothetical protein [Psychrobacter sp. 5A.1]